MTVSLLIILPMEEGTTLAVNSQSSHTIVLFIPRPQKLLQVSEYFKITSLCSTLKAKFKFYFLDEDGNHKGKNIGLDLEKKLFPCYLHHLLVKVDITDFCSFPEPFVQKLKVL